MVRQFVGVPLCAVWLTPPGWVLPYVTWSSSLLTSRQHSIFQLMAEVRQNSPSLLGVRMKMHYSSSVNSFVNISTFIYTVYAESSKKIQYLVCDTNNLSTHITVLIVVFVVSHSPESHNTTSACVRQCPGRLHGRVYTCGSWCSHYHRELQWISGVRNSFHMQSVWCCQGGSVTSPSWCYWQESTVYW